MFAAAEVALSQRLCQSDLGAAASSQRPPQSPRTEGVPVLSLAARGHRDWHAGGVRKDATGPTNPTIPAYAAPNSSTKLRDGSRTDRPGNRSSCRCGRSDSCRHPDHEHFRRSDVNWCYGRCGLHFCGRHDDALARRSASLLPSVIPDTELSTAHACAGERWPASCIVMENAASA